MLPQGSIADYFPCLLNHTRLGEGSVFLHDVFNNLTIKGGNRFKIFLCCSCEIVTNEGLLGFWRSEVA